MAISEEEAVAPTLAVDSGRATSDTAATESAPSQLSESRRIQLITAGTSVGRYVISERLGWGGMGVVYRARDPRLGRDVALKLVMPIGDVISAQGRLEIEAQAMAKLNHANVVAIFDIGTYNEQLFIAMELCSGGSLARWIKKAHGWRATVEMFIAAGRGLAAAHAIGLVHRDFKPDNVLITDGGVVKVSDFGLVRPEDRESATEVLEGTPAYMAPEQLAMGIVDARADQFAFGVSMWEALCGTKPYLPEAGGDMLEAMLRTIRARKRVREADTDVPKPLLKIIERSLEPEAAGRWPALDDMLAALEALIAPNRTRILFAAGVAAAAGIGIAAYALTRQSPTDGALPKKIGVEVAPLFAIAAESQGVDTTQAAHAYQLAYAASGDPQYRLEAGRKLISAGSCNAAIELQRYAVETRRTIQESLADDEYANHIKLTVACKRDLTSELDDIAEIEDMADQLERSDPEHGIIALQHAIRLADGKKPVLLLRLGDFFRDLGDCASAFDAYEKYIASGEPPLTAVPEIRDREKTCVPTE